ncbi:AraC family transcriptional regulator [Paenibacillus sp. P96]|uniref:AraC family transcriptional regulator n=1 Tax=Paenibacillus zeirhizosphaerae TaxID=2987519 RepID=A0ABT9FUH9_9BACL|nr:AraC family transcriptional regulator [Paenibacillus sp. P96]MDP4098355.1 AraC family transcriptional regulator [Paenibacillus sp. P96]
MSYLRIDHYNYAKPPHDPDGLHLIFWGKEACAPHHSFGPGIRDIYKVHFVHSGQGIVRTGNRTFEVYPGQGFLSFPDTRIYYQADARNPWTYSWIAFQGKQAAEILSRTAISKDQPVFPMDVMLMPKLYDTLVQLQEQSPSGDLRAQMALLDFLSTLIETFPERSAEQVRRTTQMEYIHRSLEFLHAHYNEQISIGQLAALLGLDRKYVSALFKKELGLPPQQYLLQYRMKRACEMLREGDYTVSEVAYAVGYQDIPLFSKMFKKTIGLSPKAYQTNTTK